MRLQATSSPISTEGLRSRVGDDACCVSHKRHSYSDRKTGVTRHVMRKSEAAMILPCQSMETLLDTATLQNAVAEQPVSRHVQKPS